jgi:putative phosphoribosyl transferase
MAQTAVLEDVRISDGDVIIEGDLHVPERALGLVIFAHGSGSSRFSPRNRHVAQLLNGVGFATVLADLLSPQEERLDERTRQLRFDIGLLAERLLASIDALRGDGATAGLAIGLFGASTGAAAALVAAAERPSQVAAVVSRGGRPDLAGPALDRVSAPTLLIVGGADPQVLTLNRQAAERLAAPHRLEVVPGAGHLFEEPGALEEVARLAGAWFSTHLQQLSAEGHR